MKSILQISARLLLHIFVASKSNVLQTPDVNESVLDLGWYQMFIFYDITDAILLDNAGRFIMFSVITNITFCFNLYCDGFILFCNVCVCVCVCGFCNVWVL